MLYLQDPPDARSPPSPARSGLHMLKNSGEGARSPTPLGSPPEAKEERKLVNQLHQAVNSRDTIGQAKSLLMERYKIRADAAFAILISGSSRNNMRLDVAHQLIY